jgi:Uncharacterised protein family (UPF0104).
MNADRTTGRPVLRLAAMTVIGIASLVILHRLGYLDLAPVGSGFRRGGPWIGLIVLALIGLLAASAVRFHRLTRAFGIPVRFRDAAAANLIGQAVGQWLPGSLALTEVLRFGVMAGTSAGPGTRGRLGLAVAVDRILGLGAMFAAGGLAGFVLFALGKIGRGSAVAVFALSAAAVVLGLAALAAPFRPNRRLARLAQRAAGPDPASSGLFRRAGRGALRLLKTLEEFRAGRHRAFGLLLLSLAAALFNPLTLFFRRPSDGIPSSVLRHPGGRPADRGRDPAPHRPGRVRGPQLLAAGVFALFGAEPAAVVAACLLQNTVVLAGQTLGGALGWALLSRRPSFKPGRLQ